MLINKEVFKIFRLILIRFIRNNTLGGLSNVAKRYITVMTAVDNDFLF